jgi:hypothetical protein
VVVHNDGDRAAASERRVYVQKVCVDPATGDVETESSSWERRAGYQGLSKISSTVRPHLITLEVSMGESPPCIDSHIWHKLLEPTVLVFRC